MSADTIATLAAAAVIVGFLWTLHRDMRAMDTRLGKDIADLRERMAKLEGAVTILAGNVQTVMGAIVERENRTG